MKWSQLKKRIQERIADQVRGRIDFGSTRYRRSHDREGRGWISIDKREILDLSTIKFEIEEYGEYRKARRDGRPDMEKIRQELHEKNLFSQRDLHRSLFEYLSLSIDEIICSGNLIIRAFGMLDSRLGKRRLKSIKISGEHDLVQRLYLLRCEAEKVPPASGHDDVLTGRLDSVWKVEESVTRPERSRIAAEKLSLSGRTRDLPKLIKHVFNGDISEGELDTPLSREVFAGFGQARNPGLLVRALEHIGSNSKLLKEIKYMRGVIALARDAECWARPVEEWSPTTHNPQRQFSSLARHLWARYQVPLFMDNTWLQGNVTEQGWFKHIGAGKNIRTADHLPISLTKRMAHCFLTAPEAYTPKEAFRWAQVHSLGGGRRLSDALLGTRLVREFGDDGFWLGVIRFFIRNPMLDPAQIGPIIDYIWNQKYENRLAFVDAGVAEELGPEQPNFSMRGRTVDSLLKAVEAWHRRLGKEIKGGNLQWTESGVGEFTSVEGDRDSHNMRVWRIRELLSSRELIAEGRQMRHCVASYASSCQRGVCSIWGLSVETETGIEKLITIELNNQSKEIRQIRGRLNRLATEKEKEIVRRWAAKAGLTLAPYV